MFVYNQKSKSSIGTKKLEKKCIWRFIFWRCFAFLRMLSATIVKLNLRTISLLVFFELYGDLLKQFFKIAFYTFPEAEKENLILNVY